MTDKLTDNEIVKALKKILESKLYDGDLQTASTISKAVDLINRQQAEIERLQKMVEDKGGFILMDFAKAEAVKEFAERLKHRAINIGVNDSIVSTYAIDETYKELVGEG